MRVGKARLVSKGVQKNSVGVNLVERLFLKAQSEKNVYLQASKVHYCRSTTVVQLYITEL